MKGRPLRLSSFSSPTFPFSSSSSSRYVCLQCRHRASLRRSALFSPTDSSPPFQRRTYATEPSLPDKFQAYFNKTIGKRLFKDGKIPGAADDNIDRPRNEPAIPPNDEGTATAPLDDDPYYTPATSGEELESLGGPSGWWEKAWDEGHQYQGWMRPIPMQDDKEIETAIERALVEWYTVEKGSIEFRKSVGAAHRLWANDRSWEMPAVGNFKLSLRRNGKVQLDWERSEDQMEMQRWLQEPFQKDTEAPVYEENRSVEADSHQAEADTSTTAMGIEPPEVVGEEAAEVTEGDSTVPDKILLEEDGETDEKQPKIQSNISLHNHNLKFTVIKRVMQLTGIRISDTAIPSINSSHALLQHLIQKPKPKKLAQLLIEGNEPTGMEKNIPLLAHLPNVQILPTKHIPSMTETALGRQKVIEQQLDEHGIPVPFREEIEQITAHEEQRLRKQIDAMTEDDGVNGRDMWSQEPLEDLRGQSEGLQR
ncbi:MAG: hypothetical protein LQ349_006115 [Xanthoria aureola]|nr:MAG: hypothetical protein LQ349_006115 [Xanthoria aureola]